MSLNEAKKFIEKHVVTHNGFRFSKKKEGKKRPFDITTNEVETNIDHVQ